MLCLVNWQMEELIQNSSFHFVSSQLEAHQLTAILCPCPHPDRSSINQVFSPNCAQFVADLGIPVGPYVIDCFTEGVLTIILMGCGVVRKWGNECRNGIRKGRGQSYTGVWEVRRECYRGRVWCMEDGRWQHRGKDLASTYVLRPCQGTRLSLISEETSRGDTRGLYCQGGDQ